MRPRLSQHWTSCITLSTITDLHVGTGKTGKIGNGDDAHEYAKFARDHAGAVCIPGSGLKGGMRATAEAAGCDAEYLFGHSPSEGTESETGTGGRLVPILAQLTKERQQCKLPLWCHEKQTWVRIRHARDRATQTVDADRRKLFNAELVPPGVEFTAKLLFMGSEDDLRDKVVPLLEYLARSEGFALGRSRNVLGRVRLHPGEIQFTGLELRKSALEDGVVQLEIAPAKVTLNISGSARDMANLSISFPGPVAILDPERTTREGQGANAHDVQQVLQYSDTELAGFDTALRQALRVRCAWLEVTENWNSHTKLDDPEAKLKSATQIRRLTSTQRLFGITGLRGLLSCHLVRTMGGEPQVFPGIAIDRLTGGLLQGATYFLRAPVRAEVTVCLAIDERRLGRVEYSATRQEDLALLNRLSADVARRGIKLGRHVSSGYGWSDAFELPTMTTGGQSSGADHA